MGLVEQDEREKSFNNGIKKNHMHIATNITK